MLPSALRDRSRRLAVLAILVFSIAACGGATATTAPVAGAAAQSAAAPASLPAEVDAATAATMQQAGAFMLDVREPDEWAAGHIEGATLIPLGELTARVGEVPRDQEVVVVCRSGNRSAQGRDILLGAGFPSATSMAGGMKAWTAAGNKTVTGQ